ncbi:MULTISPECIES: DUF6146 family protein [Maribacter]|uniref:DUF6146 family protein n=1 Tax=Maribacter flavus TaxID=1658664 RepID=A0ABU7IIS9_9FLAO|nr:MULTISPECIES: DUF6146 family protein [Maribacter]MDC6405468.1 DUF6146 family protein [Maribacter sp. PR66]MEE1972764.1 DUF6146 family protein [Maribacter flavus]
MKRKILNALLKIMGVLSLGLLLAHCGSTKEALSISDKERQAFESTKGDTVRIANEETEYEIIIIDPGFYTWLNSIARPEGYYSQSFLENRNILMVMEWNRRVLQPAQFSPNLYELQIDYKSEIDYGYEVNYKLYNYFIYFQRKYNQRLGPFLPRI